VIEIALRAKVNLFVNSYKVACRRNNSGGYNFSQVFVQEFGKILDQYRSKGLADEAIRKIETRMMVGYLPFYFLRQRMTPSAGADRQAEYLIGRFRGRLLFWIWIYPILALPRSLAIGWGAIVTFLGRVLNGDFRRGWRFLQNRLSSSFQRRSSAAEEAAPDKRK
jgi:hypothetical protein